MTMYEIIGPDGEVHYRRPEGDPMLEEAKTIKGYSIRKMDSINLMKYDKWDAYNAADSLIKQIKHLQNDIVLTTPNEFVTLGILEDFMKYIKHVEQRLNDFNVEMEASSKHGN